MHGRSCEDGTRRHSRIPGLLKNRQRPADRKYMRTHAATLLCVCVLICCATASRSQSSDDNAARTRILALEHAWNQAEAFKDLKALDSILDNALLYVDEDGSLLTKAEFLSRVKSAHLQKVVTQSMSVSVFGDTAVVTGVYEAEFFKDGRVKIARGRFVDTWTLRNSTWVCVAAQSTPIVR